MAQRLPAGARVGDFVVEAEIARGGMGTIYRARQRSLGDRLVALKVLPTGGSSPEEERRFLAEAQAASSLHHPHMAEVYGFGCAEGIHYYAMRLVEGPSLRELLERLAADGEAARNDDALRTRIVRRISEVAGALALVHEHGLVHRDVKPANVMLSSSTPKPAPPRESAVLVDFGLVELADSHSFLSGECAATLSYAAPELLLGRAVDARADVFSLGVALHDLLAARLPSNRPPACSGLEPLIDLAPKAGRDLSAIVAKAIDPLPQWRYADAAELHEDLEAWLAGEPIAARPLSRFESLTRWVKRNPARCLKAIAAALLFVGLAFGVATLSRLSVQARLAHSAFGRGDLARALDALEHLDGSQLSRWLLSPDLFALREAFAKADPGHGGNAEPEPATLAVSRLLHKGRDEEALLAACTFLQRDGLFAHPHCASYLAFTLEQGQRESNARSQTALLLCARLFNERPDRSPQATQASARVRGTLLSLLEDSKLSGEEELYALSALAGCGTPSSLPALLDWLAVERDPAHPGELLAEKQRLALWVMEHVLRRAHACELLDELPSIEPLVERLLTLARSSGEQHQLAFHFHEMAWSACLRALAFFERARDGELKLSVLPASLLSIENWMRLQAIAPDEVLAQRLGPLEPLGHATSFFELGWRCELLRASPEVARYRGQILALATIGAEAALSLLVEFDAGRTYARGELAGIRAEFEFDPSSHLGRQKLHGEEGRCSWHTLSLTRLPPAEMEDRPGKRALASWDFTGSTPVVRGLATGAKARDVRIVDAASDGSLLRMSCFGRSEIRLTFELPEDPDLSELQLAVRHLRAVRSYLPFQGSAFLDIRLDGASVHTKFGVTSAQHFAEDRLPLPVELLQPGTHTLSIRLAEATTTYRLASVSIEGNSSQRALNALASSASRSAPAGE